MATFNRIIVLFSCLMVFGCASKTKQDISGEQAIAASQATLSRMGSSITVRLTYEGNLCQGSFIRLRKIIDGKLDDKDSVTIGIGSSPYATAGLNEKALRQDVWFLGTTTFDKVFAKMSNSEISKAFSPIAPGDYILTSVRCRTDSGTVGMGEDMQDMFVKALLNPKKKPLLGLNFIHISQGELVDAGTLDLKHLQQSSGGNSSNQAFIMAYPATPRFQSALKQKFPDIASKIRFTRFDLNIDLMNKMIANAAR